MAKGVLLLQMGGPSNLEEVEPFLFNLFRDKYIIQLPWFMAAFQETFARIISRRRSPKVSKLYEEIGGASPIKFETESQAKALEKHLSDGTKVYYAMRYTSPFLAETFKDIEKDEIKDLTVIPLYPQYSTATSGSSLIECKEHFESTGFSKKAKIKYVENWFDNDNFIQLINNRILDQLKEFEKDGIKDPKQIHILFSAHGLPESYIKKGDPYEEQVKETVRRVMGRLPLYPHSICYQSRVGPVKWLQPSTEKAIKDLAGKYFKKNILVVPISFVGDHIETLQEIGIEYKKFAESLGVRNFKITRLPKANKLFIKALGDYCKDSSNN